MFNMYDTIVISGGSTKCISLLGAIQCLIDKDKLKLNEIENFVGTSAGAMICYFLSIGYEPLDIFTEICTSKVLSKLHPINPIGSLMNTKGLMSYSLIQEELERMTIQKIGYFPTFKDIEKNLVITTYNLTKSKVEYLSKENSNDLPCLVGLRMSSNLPFIFTPFKYNNCLYLDGGLVDNFPIDVGEKLGKNVLGLVLDYDIEYNEKGNVLEYLYKILSIQETEYLNNKIGQCKSSDIYKLSTNEKLKVFDLNIELKMKLKLFDSGYSEMKDKLK